MGQDPAPSQHAHHDTPCKNVMLLIDRQTKFHLSSLLGIDGSNMTEAYVASNSSQRVGQFNSNSTLQG